MKHVFTKHIVVDQDLSKVTFTNFDERQNRALYTLKTLMVKLTKEYGGVLKQKNITLEFLSDKKF
jgi:hypothetical protein